MGLSVGSKLSRANKLFQRKEYLAALELYKEVISENPSFQSVLGFNVSLLKKKIPGQQRIIVYTVNIAQYDEVKQPKCIDPNARYILFTDRKVGNSGIWEVIEISPKLSNPRRVSRLPKILSHNYLPEHDVSIYIDASLEFKAPDVTRMVGECLEGKDIALYRHYKRDCVYDEIEFVMGSSDRVVLDKESCVNTIKKYKEINYPKNNGLFENALIVRRNTKRVKELNEKWWDEYINGTERDQFTLMYALSTTGITPNAIKVGRQFRDNPYVNFYKHTYKAYADEGARSEGNFWVEQRPACNRKTPSINWVVGGADNAGWAYENNARRFARELREYQHCLQENRLTDVAVYFDVLLHDRYPVKSKQNILRVGGPRPVNRLCGGDLKVLRKVVSNFYAVICLNHALAELFKKVHANVFVIPNGLDIQLFSPARIPYRAGRNFTAGFAGSVKSSVERSVKGLDLVIDACRLAGIALLNVGRGQGQVQIPHNRMIDEFYRNIDVLIHPVDAGREGSSNVVMEAMALGIPVITTEHCGYHSEQLEDRVHYLRCERDSQNIAELIRELREDGLLRLSIKKRGREFAVANHDIKHTSLQYKNIIESALRYEQAATKVCFVPFWYPIRNFATSRIRSLYPAMLLNKHPNISAKVGYAKDAHVVIVSQLAEDELMELLRSNTTQFVIYDLCDRYFYDERVVGEVHAKERFYELADRSNVITVSTLTLKRELYEIGVSKPIVVIPDGIDFKGEADTGGYLRRRPDIHTVGWFGNPGRGNLESSVWLLEESLALGKKIKLITKSKSVKNYPLLYPYTVDWCPDTFVDQLSTCDVVVVSHASEEQSKSPNRLLTSISCGVPVIVNQSESCERILESAGLRWAIVNTKEDLKVAIGRLSTAHGRNEYFGRVLPVIDKEYGDKKIEKCYLDLITDYFYKPPTTKKRVLFVSHNFNFGEGAPTSLAQTVIGMAKLGHIDPVVFSIKQGGLKDLYEENDIEVISPNFGVDSRLATTVMARAENEVSDVFRDLLDQYEIDVVVLNTVTTFWLAVIAKARGISVIGVVRESSAEHVGFTFGGKALMNKIRYGMSMLDQTVFVSRFTKELWEKHHTITTPVVINNGIDLNRIAPYQRMTKETVREELRLPKDKIILLSVGSVSYRKAQKDIVKAFAGLSEDEASKCQLVFVGAKPSRYLDEMNCEILALPAIFRESITVIPETSDVMKWYRSSDIFVFASRNESYPRVVIEALSFGLPVVSTSVFGTKEQLVDNETGFFFEPGDIDALRRRMGQLVNDGVLRAQLSENAINRSMEVVGYHEMVQRHASLIMNS